MLLIPIFGMGGIYVDDNIRNIEAGLSIQQSSGADLEILQPDRLRFWHYPPIPHFNPIV